ncbi:plasmid replication, integration and excision activator [Actinopolymorpha pittospori]
MAMPRRISIPFGEAFPYGVFAVGEVEVMRDFEKSSRDREVQAYDEDSGDPIWTLDVIDADPAATKATRSLAIRIVAKHKPVLPEAPIGQPFTPVEFEGLSASPYVADSPMGNGKGRLAWSFRASGVVAPKPASAASTGARGAGSKTAKDEATA